MKKQQKAHDEETDEREKTSSIPLAEAVQL